MSKQDQSWNKRVFRGLRAPKMDYYFPEQPNGKGEVARGAYYPSTDSSHMAELPLGDSILSLRKYVSLYSTGAFELAR